MSDFEIRLKFFEGPFDLLLFFIERDEIDIYDIPISEITKDFLEYLHQLDELDIEVASEFILVAATLMRIKAKMLLPRPELDEEGNEIDPRDELVKHLLEYKRYKSVVAEFSKLELDRQQMDPRGNVLKELRSLAEITNVEAELQDVDLYKILKVYQKVLKRFEYEQNKPVHEVTPYIYTMEEQKGIIIAECRNRSRVSFEDLIAFTPDRICLIFNFLSILELIQYGFIVISVGEGFNNFWIEPTDKIKNEQAISKNDQ